MVINSGTYVGTQWAVYSYNTGSTITINGGTFKAERVVQVDGIWSTTAPAVVTINDGNFDGAFHLDWGTTPPEVYINGGNFTGNHGVIAADTGSEVIINGGTFHCTATYTGNSDWALYAEEDSSIKYDADKCTITSANPNGIIYGNVTSF
jgi:hypothetical protein